MTPLVLSILVPMPLVAGSDVPLVNWTVPPYHHASARRGLSTMTDVSPGVAFTAIQPCRVVDTRNPVGPYGGPALPTAGVRTFDVDSGPCPGIPQGVDAYSLSIGAILPATDGYLTAWANGTPRPAVSQVNYLAGEVIANAAIVPAGTSGSIDVFVSSGPTNVYVDINGYFTDSYNPGQSFVARSSTFNPAIVAYNSSTADFADAIYGELTSTACGIDSAALSGYNNTANANGFGVWGGHAGQGSGVYGTSPFGTGVHGVSRATAVEGRLVDPLGAPIAQGRLGVDFGTNAPPWAVYAQGDIGASGTKNFRDPHPTDASLVISYTSLEGPEAGTYFRGRGRFENGLARIVVPEDFRMVTAPEGLTVQVTPIGGMASVGVLRMDLNEIVVQSSRNLDFSYLVQGVRASFPDEHPIVAGQDFVPPSAYAVIPGWLSQRQKRLLVENGTYNADGTVNMETARRLGWDRKWGVREQPVETRPEAGR
ncbi:MAG TPA: hypothetical protein VF958_00490 [Thermoanaerobaculia bacterium]